MGINTSLKITLQHLCMCVYKIAKSVSNPQIKGHISKYDVLSKCDFDYSKHAQQFFPTSNSSPFVNGRVHLKTWRGKVCTTKLSTP